MPIVILKRVVQLGEGDAARVFGKGKHTIPDKLCQGWFYDALKKDGNLVEVDGVPIPGTESPPPADPPASTVDVAVLDGNANEVIKALRDGRTFTQDQVLELMDAEEQGKNRKTILDELITLAEATK